MLERIKSLAACTVVFASALAAPAFAADETPARRSRAASAEPAAPEPGVTPLSPEEALRRLEAARASTPEPTVAELKQRVHLRELEIRRMQEEMRQLNEEIARLKLENEALRMALDTIRATPIQVISRNADDPVDAGLRQPVPDAPKPPAVVEPIDDPRWTVQYSLGLIESGSTGGIRILKPTVAGVVVIRDYQNVERYHVAIRGNFKNESLTPYRYTFEIRIGGKANVAGRPPRIIGSWRYQTPLLEPGEIHQFEVKVPVTHVANVQTYEIGNVTADNPDLPPVEPANDPDAKAPRAVNPPA